MQMQRLHINATQDKKAKVTGFLLPYKDDRKLSNRRQRENIYLGWMETVL